MIRGTRSWIFVRRWSEKTEIGAGRFIRFIEWLNITASKFYDWRERYGKVNEHNGWVPRDFWLEDWEKQAIIGFHLKNPLEGYRRLTFMMLDADIVAASPSSVWRVLSLAGLLSKWNGKPSRKGTGFAQPLTAHQHWYIDVSYLNIGGTFYYLCSILDGYSRYIANWDLREAMTEASRSYCREARSVPAGQATDHLGQPPAVHRQGLQGVHSDLGHDPRPNLAFLPTVEREDRALAQIAQGECIRPGTPLPLDDARRLVQGYVDRYNNVRLNSATSYITPKGMLAGLQEEIPAERDRKLAAARQQRQRRRLGAA